MRGSRLYGACIMLPIATFSRSMSRTQIKKRQTPLLKVRAYADNFKWKGPPKTEDRYMSVTDPFARFCHKGNEPALQFYL